MARKLTSFRPQVKRQRSPRTPGLTLRSWKRFRNDLLAQRKQVAARRGVSVCVDCAIEGQPFKPLRVDGHHIEPRSLRPDLTYEPTNVEFVCKRHHAYRNNLEAVPMLEGRFVVYGEPGVGKSTLVRQFVGTAWCWDADEHTSQAFPRSDDEVERLAKKREKLVKRAELNRQRPAWFIVRWPRTAFHIATRIGGRTIRLTHDNRDLVADRLRACERWRDYEGVS